MNTAAPTGIHASADFAEDAAALLRLNALFRRELAENCDTVLAAFRACRARTLALAGPLTAEDQLLQSMPDASPTKWHLAHTSWFFETFILAEHQGGFEWFEPSFRVLYNSYYNGIGEQHLRAERGLVSRPGLAAVREYRRHVESGVESLLERAGTEALQQALPLLVLGINHEQQHQELIVTDIKHAFSRNPAWPAYMQRENLGSAGATVPADSADDGAGDWIELPGGSYEIGHDGAGFCFDNEGPRHAVLLSDCRLRRAPVSCGEWLAFMEDGGYGEPLLWLSDGWAWLRAAGVEAPLHWRRGEQGWRHLTLCGERPLDPGRPVAHVSYYEADAYARWAGHRLPTEFEWEAATAESRWPGGLRADHRSGAGTSVTDAAAVVAQREFDRNWEWTASAYLPYPGYRPEAGAVGEYNGKFMVNQMVLRGASAATPPGHGRPSYRNFFPPDARWQFSGLRLAADA